jgi:uncharacterized membrane protein YraQ (UPF0718 family)
VLAFIFADLIILPILNIYRKYYGRRMAAFLLVTFYATMAAAGLLVDLIFQAFGLVPTGPRHAHVTDAGVTLNYTTVLNVISLILAAVLIVRYFTKGGGIAMLRAMSRPMPEGHDHAHAQANAHAHGGGHRASVAS